MKQKIIIQEPRFFFSYMDEEHFFHWLEDIPFVSEVVRVQDGLEVTLDGEFDKANIRDLIAVLRRYDLDMTCLRILCTEENQDWLKDHEAYWYAYIFKDETG